MENNSKPGTESHGIQIFSKESFVILAAIGAAVGLGNLWRFPFVAFENGGGSFLIPYFLVTIFLGIPVLLYEFAIGRSTRKSISGTINRVTKKNSLIGWAIALNCFIIVTYYTVILSYCVLYLFASFSIEWKTGVEEYFYSNVLNISENPWAFGQLQFKIIFGLFIIWFLLFWITSGGIGRLEKIIRTTVIFPFIALLVILARAVTLPGAEEGISRYISPDLNLLFRVETWSAAITQVMLSLSVGMGQIIAYSARGKSSNILKGGIITALGNAGFSVCAGFAVFAALGFLVIQTDVSWSELKGGPGLAFIAYPSLIMELSWGARLFGIIFFLMLITLGIDTAFAVLEANILPLEESTGINRRKVSAVFCGTGFLVGIFYTSQAGLFWIDIIDHITTSYGVSIAILVECLLLGWKRGFLDSVSQFSGLPSVAVKWWKFSIKVLVPSVTAIILIKTIINDLSHNSNYPASALLSGLFTIAVLIYTGSKILSKEAVSKRSSLGQDQV